MAKRNYIAPALALCISPIVAAAYLHRGWLAIGYSVVSVIVSLFPFLLAHAGLLKASPVEVSMHSRLLLQMAGAVHCYYLAQRPLPFHAPWYARWQGLVAIVTFPILFALLLRSLWLEPYQVMASSMSPTLLQGDYILSQKTALQNYHPKRGDVVVFDYQGNHYIKRIIGIAGDVVQMKQSLLSVNGKEYIRERLEDFILQDTAAYHFREESSDGKVIHILDEASDAPMDNTPIYTVPSGHVFVIGDRRDHSLDSRFLDNIGYVSEAQIVAIARWKLWSNQTRKISWETIN